MNVGRNDPCPCGSGKKYKQCHLGRDESARVGAEGGRLESPIDLDRRLATEIRAFARRRFGEAWSPSHAGGLAASGRPGLAAILDPLDVHALAVDEKGTVARRFLAERRDSLSRRERAWIEAQGGAWPSVWRIDRVERATGFDAVDLLTGQQRFVREPQAGLGELEPGRIVLARIVDFEGAAYLFGVHPTALPAALAGRATGLVREAIGQRGGPIRPERLLEEDATVAVVDLWEDLADEAELG